MIKTKAERAALDFQKILDVLDRRTDVEVFYSLVLAVKSGEPTALLAKSAIIIDANAVLRIPGHRKSSDIIDYLVGVHDLPIVVPGQVVQEFWNNQLSAVNSIYKNILVKHNELDKEVSKAKDAGVIQTTNIASAVDSFKLDNEHLFDPDLVQKTSLFLEKMYNKALVPHAPRQGLDRLAAHRKLSKTPPGFRDDGDGDFLVWVDSLFGLLSAQRSDSNFESVILLTNDKKLDWCRGFTAHPILHAEMRAILGTHLEVWTLDYFASQL